MRKFARDFLVTAVLITVILALAGGGGIVHLG